ncbi:hypothetical protein niasHT_015485 [Heterodera trifolii]|uniref:ETS domain-containing protein n=1 Tax=Heterodera trifolii TaxID=157864 RepID=A0ABD2L046_9BILA
MFSMPMPSFLLSSPSSTSLTPVQTPVLSPIANDSRFSYHVPMSFSPFSPPPTPTFFQAPVPVTDDTLLRLANFVRSTNSDTQQQQQLVRQQQMAVIESKDDDARRISAANIGTMSRVEMLELVRAQVRSPIVDFLCMVLSDFNQFGHFCSFIDSREFKILNTKTFTELLNLRSKQKPKSYLQVARALKSYEGRLVDGHVMLRKVKDKRNQFKFFPDLP